MISNSDRWITALLCLVLSTSSIALKTEISKLKPMTNKSVSTELTSTISTTISSTIITNSGEIHTTTPSVTTIQLSNGSAITLTTTPLPLTTTAIAATSSKPPPADQKNESQFDLVGHLNVDYSEYFCACNLRRGQCDINCCCDVDCVKEQLRSFDCNKEQRKIKDLFSQQGLPSCEISGGWLCVFRRNIGDQKQNRLHNIELTQDYHQWPHLIQESIDYSTYPSPYKIGQPLLLYSVETDNIIEFDLPYSLTGDNCEIFESVRHLEVKELSCYITVERAQFIEFKLIEILGASLLMQDPQIQTQSDVKDPESGFIPITLQNCTTYQNCTSISVNSSFSTNAEDYYCTTIQTKIYHNISHPIRMEVLFFPTTYTSPGEVWQHFKVDFINTEDCNMTISKNVSGPLGYIYGRPIIIAEKMPLNETAQDHLSVFSYFHPNQTKPVNVNLPARVQGECAMSDHLLNFGESILVQCLVPTVSPTELNSGTNFTRICDDIQRHSLRFLQVDSMINASQEIFFSVLGHPINSTSYWTKVEVKNYEPLPIIGAYLDKDNSFICQNMILDFNLELLTGADSVQGISGQYVLKKATIEVGVRHDLEFLLNEHIALPMTYSVIFKQIETTNSGKHLTFGHELLCLSLIVVVHRIIIWNDL